MLILNFQLSTLNSLMGARREARIAALMALYARDVGGEKNLDFLAENTLEMYDVPKSSILFFHAIVEEVINHLPEIDTKIQERAENWAMDRIAIVDRNILRIGVAELLYFQDIPPKTTINECIELAKMFGTSESARFVNGLLDGILRRLDIEKTKELK